LNILQPEAATLKIGLQVTNAILDDWLTAQQQEELTARKSL